MRDTMKGTARRVERNITTDRIPNHINTVS
jgi:hypothetical protein